MRILLTRLFFYSRYLTLEPPPIPTRGVGRTSCHRYLMHSTASSRILVELLRDRPMLRRSRLMKDIFHLIMLRRQHT